MLPRRLHPVFRDRDEFASSSDLSRSIRQALESSDALIVICSPAASRSRWVDEEIRHFQTSGRGDRIFCLLVEGTPERDAEECAFPSSLLYDEDGQPRPDPLAADVRANADGKRGAMLKIAAGLLGVGVDDLRQRDAQRQLRLRGVVAVGSLLFAAVTMGLLVVAQLAREEADVRRVQAERMIGFMLGDLRTRLEPLGRLDLLDVVGDEAMSYFAALADRGTEQEIFARAMALRQIGEVRFRQGRMGPAAESFAESRDIAETLYASAPENLDYLFELGQAEFWVGYTAFEQSQLDSADSALKKYMEYSRKLLVIEPENTVYQLELSYAYSNLGAVALELRKPQRALDYFEEGLALNLTLVGADPDNSGLRHELGNVYSWLGATLIQLERLEEGGVAYRDAVAVLSELREESDDLLTSEHFGQNLYHLGQVRMNQGELTEAASLFEAAHSLFNELVTHDEDNAIWRGDRAISAYHRAELLMVSNEREAARQFAAAAAADFERLVERDPADLRSIEHLALAKLLIALLALDEGSIQQALALGSDAQAQVTGAMNTVAIKPRTVVNAGRVAEAYGIILLASGDESAAISTWETALELLQANPATGLERIAVERQVVAHLRSEAAVNSHTKHLAAAGFNDPRFR